MSLILTKLTFSKRIIIYLITLLILQCIIAYGALLVFDALPPSITGVPEDHTVQRDSQKGTVSLIRMQINEHKNLSVQQVVDNLQPLFGYPITVLEADVLLPSSVKKELDEYGTAYDEDLDILYVSLDSHDILKLGPILMRDILESDFMPFSVFIFLWSLFSVAIFFILIYFAFVHFWKDLVNIRKTAERLGQGDLDARTEEARSWLFRPLASVLNNMGVHIKHLVTTSETISHAMAHELRTPLARMRFELSMLDEARNDEERIQYRKGLDEDIDELESLIKVSLSYFKMQQSQFELNLTEVPLKEWSERLCKSLALLKPKNFELECNSQDDTALFDINLSDTIVKNLLLNAFKYANSKAIFSVFKKEDKVVFVIDDDGPGVPIEFRDRVFMPFSRLDTSRTRTTGGYGLGLAYVKLIAEIHNGKAFVVTSPLGGARFVVAIKSGD